MVMVVTGGSGDVAPHSSSGGGGDVATSCRHRCVLLVGKTRLESI